MVLVFFTTLVGCKAKKCANFTGDDAKHKVNYNKKGLVKKKGKSPAKNWSNY